MLYFNFHENTFVFAPYAFLSSPAELIFLIFDTHAGSGVVCTFKDKTYNPGDSWHPYLEPFGLMFCMRCLCTEVLSPHLLLLVKHIKEYYNEFLNCPRNSGLMEPMPVICSLSHFPFIERPCQV